MIVRGLKALFQAICYLFEKIKRVFPESTELQK